MVPLGVVSVRQPSYVPAISAKVVAFACTRPFARKAIHKRRSLSAFIAAHFQQTTLRRVKILNWILLLINGLWQLYEKSRKIGVTTGGVGVPSPFVAWTLLSLAAMRTLYCSVVRDGDETLIAVPENKTVE